MTLIATTLRTHDGDVSVSAETTGVDGLVITPATSRAGWTGQWAVTYIGSGCSVGIPEMPLDYAREFAVLLAGHDWRRGPEALDEVGAAGVAAVLRRHQRTEPAVVGTVVLAARRALLAAR